MVGKKALTEKQPRRNTDIWRGLVEEWRSSDLSKSAWCLKKGLSYESLRRWTLRFEKPHGKQRLVPIRPALAAWNEPIRIRLDGELAIELPATAEEELILRVLRAAREANRVR
jgi:hypothetical protein